MKPHPVLICWLIIFCSCAGESNNPPAETKDALNSEEVVAKSNASPLHNIALQESGGLKAKQAFLTFGDGRLLPKDHRVNTGDVVLLKLILNNGWVIKDGQVSIDAAQTITTNQDEVILNDPNLFTSRTITKAQDAKQVVLKTLITKTNKEVNFFTIAFRLWDRWGSGEIKGSYRLYVNNSVN